MMNGWAVGSVLVLVGCSSSSSVPDGNPDSSTKLGSKHVDARADVRPDVERADVTPDAPTVVADAGIDAPCVPKMRAEVCAGKTCGLASDGCEGSLSCMTDAGICPLGQGCGAVDPNVCGGCVPADAGTVGCEGQYPYTDCPIVAYPDGGSGPYLAPGCTYNEARDIVCCS